MTEDWAFIHSENIFEHLFYAGTHCTKQVLVTLAVIIIVGAIAVVEIVEGL